MLRSSAVLRTLSSVATASILAAGLSARAHPGIHEQERAVAEALAERPSDPAMHLRQGRVHAERGEWDAALESYERARIHGAAPDEVDVIAGATLLDAGWPRMAKLRFEAVLARRPERHDARLGRARAWMKLGHPDEAAADYAVAVAEMDEPRPAYALEQRDALVAAGRRSDALAALDAAMARMGRVPTLELAAIDLALELDRADEALDRLDGLLARSPAHPLWLAKRAKILEEAGRPAEARLAYTDALERIRARSARSPSRRLTALEGELRAALDRQPNHPEGNP